ncbi:MAG: type II toxin-antitoxin system VapC family toxin [Bacteroidota bacterium]
MGKKRQIVLCDTNILFELLKGNEKVKWNLEKIGDDSIAFSIITHAEAYAGCSKKDMNSLKSFFAKYQSFHINEEASKLFHGLIISNHSRHSKWIPDALIAATALSNNLEVFTLNRKDFDFIPGLKLYNPKG